MKQNDLDTMFNFDDKESENLLKQAKSKSNIRIMGISLSMIVFTLALLCILKVQITPWLINDKISILTNYYNTHGANIFLGTWNETYKLFGSSATSIKYKLIDGIPYEIGEIDIDKTQEHYKLNMGTGDDWTVYQDSETFSYKGNHIMKFYHPELNYRNYKNDLTILENIDSNKKIELALSLDKAYTLDEIKQMLPDNISWNWSWVDTFDEESINGLKEMDNGISYSPNIILEEDEVIGFSMTNQVGEIKEQPENDFLESIKFLTKIDNPYKKDAKAIDTLIKDKEIKIIGIVVSGNTSELQKLKDKPYIKASSFGVILELY